MDSKEIQGFSRDSKGNTVLRPRFVDVKIWQFAHELTLVLYTLTKQFPRDELYGLTNQLRRAAVSITLNIAEGVARQYDKETIQFLFQARSSLWEVQAALLIARDLKYASIEKLNNLISRYCVLENQINKFISFRKNKNL